MQEKARYIYKNCSKHGQAEHILENSGFYRCKKCRADHVKEHRRRVKQKLVDTFGGKCILCGYNKCRQALQFHHVFPETKSFGIADDGITHSFEKKLQEATKCILICGNCHVEVENKIAFIPDVILKEMREKLGLDEIN